MNRDTATSELKQILSEEFKTDPEAVIEAMTFKDLGIDDAEFGLMILAMEDKFNIELNDDETKRIVTVRHALNVIVDKTGG